MPASPVRFGNRLTPKRPNVSFRPPTEQERAGAKVGATVDSDGFTATEDALRRGRHIMADQGTNFISMKNLLSIRSLLGKRSFAWHGSFPTEKDSRLSKPV